MKPAAFDYHAPSSLAEALELLEAHPDAKLLAGGQSLVPVLNFRLAAPSMLIDLNRVPELSAITLERDGALVAGAMTRHRAFEHDAAIRRAQPLAALAVPHIAHTPIRNRGTLGGSLCLADPAAEWPAVALACGAEMSIASASGARCVAAADFFQGLLTTAVGPAEILASVRFPAWPAHRRAGFVEFSRRHGDFAIIGVAAWVELDSSRRAGEARIALFGAADTPVTVPEAAQALAGKSAGPALDHALREAGRIARARIQTRSDNHASAEYRSELIEVLVRRTLEQALGGAAKAA